MFVAPVAATTKETSERADQGRVPRECRPATRRELRGEAAQDLPPRWRQPRAASITDRSEDLDADFCLELLLAGTEAMVACERRGFSP
jgi:hypothetical protein